MGLLYRVDPLDKVEGSVEHHLAHEQEILHRSGVIFLRRPQGEFMVQQRPPNRTTTRVRADASVAFHVAFGESYEAAAMRELQRASGIETPLTFLGKFRHKDPPEHQIVAVFSGLSDAQVRIDPLESMGWEWLTKDGIDSLLKSADGATPWLRTAWRLVRHRL